MEKRSLELVVPTLFADTPLHRACRLGDVVSVREILSCNPKLACESNSQGSTPLHLASAAGYLEIVRELLKIKEAAIKDHSGFLSELFHAAPNPHRALSDNREVQSIVDKEYLKSEGNDENSVMHHAIAEKRKKWVWLSNRSNGTRYLIKRLTWLGYNVRGAEAVKISDLPPWKRSTMTTEDRLEKRAKLMMVIAMLIATTTATMPLEVARNHQHHNALAHYEWNVTRSFCTSGPFFMAIDTVGFLSSLSIVALILIRGPGNEALIGMTTIAISSMIVCLSCYSVSYPFAQVAVVFWFVAMFLFVETSLILPFGKWLLKKYAIIAERKKEEEVGMA